ncbi:MAG: exo-alpha-sialidase [Thermoleophilia bacterium]|nr:exo-alpha-sialidase [Thermoleophilia bacterium]
MRFLVALASLVLFAGAAAGATARVVTGTNGRDVLRGTNAADVLRGLGGSDRLFGLGGSDLLDGGGGRDRVAGGRGPDRITIEHDGASDRVQCGPGRDVVAADRRDGVARDCEVVSRAISRDPYRNADSQHETQVEPDSFGWRSTIVSAFQTGRFTSGGASNIGWATSRDGGRSWRSGFLPRLTRLSRPAGTAERASDPVVAYAAAHRVWLITSLLVGPRTQLSISRSRDGLRWGAPVIAASVERQGDEVVALDKQWLACDNGTASPFRGRCYLSYTDLRTGRRIVTQTSSDGGRTWSAPVFTARGDAVGAFPVSRPNGDLVVVYSDWTAILAARSTDGGASFSAPVRIGQAVGPRLGNYRAFPALASADADRSGTVYVTWYACRLRGACSTTDVVLATSADGATWSGPVRVPTRASGARVPVTPAIAVDPATSGATARLAIVYYTLSRVPCDPCSVDAWLVRSRTGGRTWGRPQRLTPRSMSSEWLPETTLGRMLADYVSVTWTGGRPVPVFALASERRGTAYRQAIFATRLR